MQFSDSEDYPSIGQLYITVRDSHTSMTDNLMYPTDLSSPAVQIIKMDDDLKYTD